MTSPRRGRAIARYASPVLLGVQAALLAWSAYVHSPVASEVGHLPAGISHWEFGRFDLYRVNPPLVRLVAAVPVLLAGPKTDWMNYSFDPLTRSERAVGVDFVNANGPRAFTLYTLGRLACIPFSLLGAYACCRWARDLFGLRAGLTAQALWCFCPNLLGNGALIMPDVPAAALGVASCYLLWRWLRRPAWWGAVAAGIVLGTAELAKSTMLVLLPLWPLLWAAYRLPDRRLWPSRQRAREAAMIASQLAIAIYVLNLGYGFEGTFQRLGDYRFRCQVLTNHPPGQRPSQVGNRFRGTWLAAAPIPLPKDYVQGLDMQKLDFERGMQSYLRGQWNDRGWWYFYLYALAIKVPLGAWALVILSSLVIARAMGRRSVARRNLMLLLAPFLALLTLVSSQTGFSIHFRYVLPVLPFAYIWASGAATACRRRGRCVPILVGACLTWIIAGTLGNYPHSLAYFNELAGGSRRGHEHLLDSAVAWGQDLLYLKSWYDAHPEARPLRLASFGVVDPRIAGIQYSLPPLGPSLHRRTQTTGPGALPAPLPPGVYLVDVNYVQGSSRPVPDGKGGLEVASRDGMDFSYFQKLKPASRVGASYLVFEVSGLDSWGPRPNPCD